MLRVSKSLITKRHFTHSSHCLQIIKAEPIPNVFVKPIQRPPSYARPILFGAAASTSIFFGAAFIHEREKETLWQQLKRRAEGPKWSTIRDIITDDKLLLADFWEEKKKLWLEKKQAVMDDLKRKMDQYNSIPVGVKKALLGAAQTYLSMTDAEKTMIGLMSINVLVFGAWRVRALQSFMNRYFVHNPSSGKSITLITSCFSHKDFLHLALNMVGLWSFGPYIHNALGREQFVAMYLSMGIGANVASHVISIALRHSRPIIPSLGASGGLYGLLAGTAMIYPTSNVVIAFLPFLPIRISYAVPALMGLDIAGILLRWRTFDHIAHLSGAALGLAYMQFGPTYVWSNMIQTVRSLKSKKGNGSGGGDDKSGALMEMPKKIKWRLFGKKVAVPEEQ